MGGYDISNCGALTCTALSCTSETDTGVLTAGGLITANGGLTVPSGQTITLSGSTLIGPAPTIIVSSATAYTMPAQTNMRVVYIFNGNTSSPVSLTLTSPTAAYVGQMITIVNYNFPGTANVTVSIGTKLGVAQNYTTYNATGYLWGNGNSLDVKQYQSYTLMYLGSNTSNITWASIS